jgi:hypothetical protein
MATTVIVWLAMEKNRSVLSAALMTRRRLVSPAFTGTRKVSELEHLNRSPGCPFIVNASETLGAAPVRVAWFTISIGFLFHHSPRRMGIWRWGLVKVKG